MVRFWKHWQRENWTTWGPQDLLCRLLGLGFRKWIVKCMKRSRHQELKRWCGGLTRRSEARRLSLPWCEAWFWKFLRKAKSWSAPGPDGMVNFWWKVFPEAGHALHLVPEELWNGAIPFLNWLVTGKTYLIPKTRKGKGPQVATGLSCEHPVQVYHSGAGWQLCSLHWSQWPAAARTCSEEGSQRLRGLSGRQCCGNGNCNWL